MRWPEAQRIKWLKERKEPFRRKDLMKVFGVSLPQASHDIQKFLLMFPGVWEYNNKAKYYMRKVKEDEAATGKENSL